MCHFLDCDGPQCGPYNACRQGHILLCRRSLQYALGLETVLLVALFALYARYNRKAQELEMDADEVGFYRVGRGMTLRLS